MTEEPAPDYLSYEAWLAYRKVGKQRAGVRGAARPSSKAPGEKSKSKQGKQEKTALIFALGRAIAAIVVEVSIIYCLNVP